MRINEKNIKSLFKEKQAITLIALIITVIIMLILAGVAINVIMRDNGLFDNIKSATEKYDLASQEEKEEYEEIIGMLDNYYMTQANSPKLSQGMIPIKYVVEKQNWYICSKDDPEWYSYTIKDKKWANVMLSDGKYDTSTSINTEVKEDELGSMFVWIPRYAYKITEGYHQNDGKIDVIWLSGNTYQYTDANGVEKLAKNGNEVGVITSNGYTDYVVHPAFTDGSKNNELSEGINENYSNGEWKNEIEGIWVSKFEAGFATTDEEKLNIKTVPVNSSVNDSNSGSILQYPVFKGGKYAYNYLTTLQAYELSLALDDNDNPYGIQNMNSHLIKNSEWGCVAYLSFSKYGYSNGKSGRENQIFPNNLAVIINGRNSGIQNPNYEENNYYLVSITGYTAENIYSIKNYLSDVSNYWSENTPLSLLESVVIGNLVSYRWNNIENGGTKSSTTGNIYGIYDMSGGVSEFVSSYVYIENSENLIKYAGNWADGVSTYLSTKYPYQVNPSINYISDDKDATSAYLGFNNIFGDAMYEVSSDVGNENTWLGGTLESDSTIDEPFMLRGGRWYTIPNICSMLDYNNPAAHPCGFRSVLILE